MLELLKKIGIPATVAAVIATLVTITPFLFKIDERYAKQSELVAQSARTEKAISDMAIEVGRLAGTQQVLTAIMAAQAQERRVQVVAPPAPERLRLGAAPTPTSALPVPVAAAATPASAPVVKKLDEVSRALLSQQARIQSFKY